MSTKLVTTSPANASSARTPGNIGPVAEFNAFADPEAMRIVLQSGAQVRTVGLNVTRRSLLHLEDADRLACAVHDPLAVAVAARPDLVRWEPCYVDVDAAAFREFLVGRLLGGQV